LQEQATAKTDPLRDDNQKGKGEGKSKMRGSLHCGGKCAAFGRDDASLGGQEKILN